MAQSAQETPRSLGKSEKDQTPRSGEDSVKDQNTSRSHGDSEKDPNTLRSNGESEKDQNIKVEGDSLSNNKGDVEEKEEQVEPNQKQEPNTDESQTLQDVNNEEEKEKDVTLDEEEEDENQGQDDDNVEQPEEGIHIDLSRFKRLNQLPNRPTLPYLLTEYGMVDKDVPQINKGKGAGEKEKKKKKKKSFGDDSMRDREREKQQEEKHIQIFNDMKKLRDYYYDEYTTLLQNKVDEQRQKIKKHDRMLKKRIAQEEKQEHGLKKRLDRHEFVSDDSFLSEIPKSDAYHIVQLQDKLIREGTLKTQTDLANFWNRIQEPDIFYMYFKTPKSDDPRRQESGHSDWNENASSKAASTMHSSISSLSAALQQPKKDGGPRALSRIAESRENSRPGTRTGQHWAITQQFQSQHRAGQHRAERRRSSFTGLNKPVEVKSKSSYLQELERRFPKLEMPKLHCFTMNLGPKPPDPEEVRHQCQLRELEKSRKAYSHKLNKMHQLAMANAAAASRILEMHEDIDFILNGAPLTDLISDHHFYSGLPPTGHHADVAGPSCSSPLPGEEASQRPQHLSSVFEQDEAAISSSRQASALRTGQSSAVSGKGKRSKGTSPSQRQTPLTKTASTPIIPLSYEEIRRESQTVPAKCLSTLWTNYMRDPLQPASS